MSISATSRSLSSLCLLAVLAVSANTANAQAVDLGSEFIFFVDGTNVLVPNNTGEVVDDPVDPTSGNKVVRFGYADWAEPAFNFDAATGADMTAMVGETALSGKTLYLKVLVDPALAGRGNCSPDGGNCASISFFDAVQGPQDADALAAGTSDAPFRLKWFIPEWMKDGAWHELALPLPPTTIAALDSAKAGKNVDGSDLATPLDSMSMRWNYSGAWAGGFGIGCCGSGTPGSSDPLWQEFQWGNVPRLGVHYDFADGGGGAVFFDDVYIGDSSTDLGAASGAPSAMSGVTFEADGATNKVSWAHNADFGGYRVYADTEAITQARIDAGEVGSLGTVAFNAADFSMTHAYEVPHGSMAPMDIHYAVTSTSLFGVENTDVSASSGVIANGDLAVQAFITEMDADAADAIFSNLAAGVASPEGFPDGHQSFNVDMSHWKSGDGSALPNDEADISGKFWLGFNREFGELYVYAEVMDDVEALHPGTSACNGCEAWAYDSVEMGWGSYDVRDVDGGSIFGGSPHANFGRGDAPDYQLRFSNLGTGETSTFSSGQAGAESEGEIAGGGTVFEDLTDGSGAVVGYKFLSLMPYAGFVAQTADAPFVPPAEDALKLIPFNIAINDGDAAGQNPRDLQVQWSTKANADGSWWNTPAQWMVVAVAGAATPTADEDEVDLPYSYALNQNYPNPFNPSTTIDFSLASTQRVDLAVYNVLGQKVATLINGDSMAPGSHQVRFNASHLTSGVYLIKLEAGTAFSQSRSIMLLK